MKFFYLSILSIILNFSFLQAQTTLVTGKLHFHSELEKQAFQLKGNNLEEQILQLLAVNPKMEMNDVKKVKMRLEMHFKLLETKGVRKKKIKKATKLIFDETHAKFLNKYEFYAEFHQIFENGVYNCVTASALYALIFDHFDIPYEIREIPSHVYVIAYPKTENIIVETTDPINGIYAVDKKKYVEELAKMKIISQQEVNVKSTDELYSTYVEEEEKPIDMHQLIGDLYYNVSVFHTEAEDYYKTYAYLKKAQNIYDKKAARLMEMGALLLIAQKADIAKPESMKSLLMLLNFEEYEELIINDIHVYNSKAAQSYLINDYQPQKYDAFYHYIINAFDNEKYKELATGIKQVYYSQTARSWHLQSKLDKAITYVDSAYQYGPNNLEIRAQVSQMILEDFNYFMTNLENEEEIEAYFKKFNHNLNKFPFLLENQMIQEIQILEMVMKIGQLMDDEKMDEVETHIFKTIQKLKELPNKSKKGQRMVEKIYSDMYSYYLVKEDDENAKLWIDKGLKQFPESEILLHDKKVFEEYLKTREEYKKYRVNSWDN